MRCDGYKFLEMARAIEIECGEKERKKKSFFFLFYPPVLLICNLSKFQKGRRNILRDYIMRSMLESLLIRQS